MEVIKNDIIYFGHSKQKETFKQHEEGMNCRKKGTQKEIIDFKTREKMITYSQIIMSSSITLM
jgi:hypothetical protein